MKQKAMFVRSYSVELEKVPKYKNEECFS